MLIVSFHYIFEQVVKEQNLLYAGEYLGFVDIFFFALCVVRMDFLGRKHRDNQARQDDCTK